MAGSCVSAWPGKYISPISLLKASLVYAADSAEVTYVSIRTGKYAGGTKMYFSFVRIWLVSTNKSITRGHTKLVLGNRCLKALWLRADKAIETPTSLIRTKYFTFLPIPSTTPSSSFVPDSLPNVCFAGFFPRTLIALHDTRLPTFAN
ncbi:hypothetical protein EMCRGX_G011771 [Ephydatia muelleri]